MLANILINEFDECSHSKNTSRDLACLASLAYK